MSEPSVQKQPAQVREMFSRIAPRYDLMNRLMTLNQDQRWRRFVIQRTDLPPNGRLLDIGTGTGDLAHQALRKHPSAEITAADFTLPMIKVGRERFPAGEFSWTASDSLHLPFPEDSFDAVVSGFLLRNLHDLHRGLQEQHRVLKPGGRLVALDTTQPPRNPLSPLINLYLHRIIPLLGRAVTGQPEAYRYLPETTEGFIRAERLTGLLAAVGFRKINFRRFMFGMIAVHWGEK